MKEYIKANEKSMLETLKELCAIPAPSHMEHERAAYCKKWLENAGAEGVYIDEALNVVFPLNCEDSNEITVIVAHTDTVFPDLEPMPYVDDGEKIYCPGVGDDIASVVVLMTLAKFFVEQKLCPPKGILFVFNSCEEGLGNLKGTRQIFKDFEGRIAQFISFDSDLSIIADRCAGSHRYEVEVLTEGGHSFQKFGNANAINELCRMVSAIYDIEVPQKEGTKTTYNVGEISGGTSVNTIAQSAKMLCEYRSTDRECLEIMRQKFEAIFEQVKSDSVQVNVKKIGDRPCSNIEDAKIEKLRQICRPIIESVIAEPVSFKSSSTDCNIPLSLGIPALCIGVHKTGGAHTREEWVDKESLISGLEVAIRITLSLAGEQTTVNEEVPAIIKKWYQKLDFPKMYDTEFYQALNEIKISDAISIEKYDVSSKDGKKNLLSMLFMCEKLAEKYRERGISENVLRTTLSDLVIWTNTWSNLKGELYLGELDWLKRHLEMRLFRLGRLQFCMAQAECDIPCRGVKAGDNVLEIHIPEGEPLSKEACLQSIEAAKKFFKEYFPEFDYKCFTCHSWLLDASLEKFLKPESNVLQFGRMFDAVHIEKSDAILRYLFRWDTTRYNLELAAPYNSFTDAVKHHVMQGGEFYEVLGVLR